MKYIFSIIASPFFGIFTVFLFWIIYFAFVVLFDIAVFGTVYFLFGTEMCDKVGLFLKSNAVFLIRLVPLNTSLRSVIFLSGIVFGFFFTKNAITNRKQETK